MKIKGNVRGEIIIANALYIKEKRGEQGLMELENTLKELGYPIEFKTVKPLEWYSEALSSLAVITAKEIFSWSNDDIFEMGKSAPKISLIVIKLFLKYLVSIRRIFEMAPVYWQKYFDTGRLESVEINEEKKFAIVRVRDHLYHPLICIYEAGYFLGVIQLTGRLNGLTITETNCEFRGDPFHEYILRWQ